jgi:chromosome partitioning protein
MGMNVHVNGLTAGNRPEREAFSLADIGGEHPDVILREVASRVKPTGHVIVFANEKGGVGKSTLAFHTAVALANAGKKVAVIDLDFNQATVSRTLSNREATARLLKIALPCPSHVTLSQHSGAYLCQEIARIGNKCSYIIIDVAGGDSPIARRAIAMANTLVTPVNGSFADLDLLGQFDPTTMKLKRLGHFGRVVQALFDAREARRIPEADWVVMPNRTRRNGSNNELRINEALQDLSHRLGFRVGQGLGERVAYRELFLFGLTHLDLKLIPKLARVKANAREEVEQLITDLHLSRSKVRQPSLLAPILLTADPDHQAEVAAA